MNGKIPVNSKACNNCKKVKDLNSYYVNNAKKDRRMVNCIECEIVRGAAYRERDRVLRRTSRHQSAQLQNQVDGLAIRVAELEKSRFKSQT